MALFSCYECEKEISEKAPACPHCGAPNLKDQQVSPVAGGTILSESDQGVPKKDKLYQLLVRLGYDQEEEYEGDPVGEAAALFEPAWDAEALVYRATGPLEGFEDEVSRGNRAEQPKECVTVRIPVNTNIHLIGPKTIEQLRSQGIHTNAEILNHSAHLGQFIHGVGPQRQESLQLWALEVSTHEDLLAIFVYGCRKTMIERRNARIWFIVGAVCFFIGILILFTV